VTRPAPDPWDLDDDESAGVPVAAYLTRHEAMRWMFLGARPVYRQDPPRVIVDDPALDRWRGRPVVAEGQDGRRYVGSIAHAELHDDGRLTATMHMERRLPIVECDGLDDWAGFIGTREAASARGITPVTHRPGFAAYHAPVSCTAPPRTDTGGPSPRTLVPHGSTGAR